MAEHVTVDVPRRPRDDGVGVGHDLGNGGREDEPTTGTPAAMASMSTCPNCSAHVEVVREGSTSVSSAAR